MQLSQPRILNQKYCILGQQLLGKGSTGDVYLGFYRNNVHNRVAIKVIDLKKIKNEVTSYLLACQIAALNNVGKLANSSHDNVVKLHDLVIIDTYIYLVMQLLEGKTLRQYLKSNPNGLPYDQTIHLFVQILQGYIHISNKKIVHRDLKPDNIIFKTNSQTNKELAIIDFGYCQMDEVPNKPQMHYNVGSPKYMSPQAYKNSEYSQKSDIWALGIIFYEMLMGKTCDVGMSMQNYLQMIQKEGITLPNSMNRLSKQILIQMLQYDPQNRSSGIAILNLIKKGQKNLIHHKSQAILHRQTLDSNNRQNAKLTIKQTGNIFQSVILGGDKKRNIVSGDNSARINRQSFIFQNATNQNANQNNIHQNMMIQKMQLIQNMIPQTPHQGSLIKQKLQNVHLESARQIIHKRQLMISQNKSLAFQQNHRVMNSRQTVGGVRPTIFIRESVQNQNNIVPKHISQHNQHKKVFINYGLNNNENVMRSTVNKEQSNTSTQNTFFSAANAPVPKQQRFFHHNMVNQQFQEYQNYPYYAPEKQVRPVRPFPFSNEIKVINTPSHNMINQSQVRQFIYIPPVNRSIQSIKPFDQTFHHQERYFNPRNQHIQHIQPQPIKIIQGYSN